jgi:hypothetical protein
MGAVVPIPRCPGEAKVIDPDPEIVAVPPDTHAAFTVLTYETEVVVDSVTVYVPL